jgi:hypothetical protein
MDGGHVNLPPLVTDEEVLSMLDARHDGWTRDREGWVTLERDGIAWRVHYRRGQLVEMGWWGTLAQPPARRRGGRFAAR